MKIFFIGSVEFSKSALEKLIDMGSEVVGVATKSQSQFNSDFADLSGLAKKNNIPIIYTDDVNDVKSVEYIRACDPDVIYCFGWSSLIKEDLLNLAPFGVIGFHPAKLPSNRGRHPIIWALALGLEETASTFFIMDKKADSGPILSQKNIAISYYDNARSLYNKIIKIALIQIEEFTIALSNNRFEKKDQRQDESNFWRKRKQQDGRIDFRMNSRAIYNLVRALAKPYIGAHVEFDGREIKVWRVEEVVCNAKNIEPGKIIESTGKEFKVKTSDGAINIIEHEFVPTPRVGMYL